MTRNPITPEENPKAATTRTWPFPPVGFLSRQRMRLPSEPRAIPNRYAPSKRPKDAGDPSETNEHARYQRISYESETKPDRATRTRAREKLTRGPPHSCSPTSP